MYVPLKFAPAASVRFTLVVVIPAPLIVYVLVHALLLSPSAYTYTWYPVALVGNPVTLTVVVAPVASSRYPFIIRTFPG